MATSTHAVRLAQTRREFEVATPDFATAPAHRRVSEFLSQVREVLGMDVAFVAEVNEDRRVFRVVSVAAGAESPVARGGSDPLVDSYCKRIIEGDLPSVIPDTASEPASRDLAITQRLRIGAYLSVPVVLHDGSLYGTLCCFSHDPRPDLREEDAQALRDVAATIAAAISRSGQVRGQIWPD